MPSPSPDRDAALADLSDLGFASIADGIREGAPLMSALADVANAEREADPDTDPDVFPIARALILACY